MKMQDLIRSAFRSLRLRPQPAVLGVVAIMAAGFSAAGHAQNDRPVTRLSPQIRETPLPGAVPEIQRASIEKFLVENRMVSPEVFEEAPVVVAAAGGNLVIGSGEEVYVRGHWPQGINRYDLVRTGTSYRDPEDGDVLGFEIIRIGSAEVDLRGRSVEDGDDGEVRTARVLNNTVEIKAGDRLLPRDNESLVHTYFPVPANIPESGQIIGLLGDLSMAAQYDSVVLDLGTEDGLKVGDLLSIHEAATSVPDPVSRGNVSIPGKEVGTLMVYRSFERLSYGLIIDSTQPAQVAYQVQVPE